MFLPKKSVCDVSFRIKSMTDFQLRNVIGNKKYMNNFIHRINVSYICKFNKVNKVTEK